MIAILCPSRARPEGYRRMFDSAVTTTEANVYLFGGSNGGDDYMDTQYPIDMPTCYMWNDLARQALANPKIRLFMLGADDMLFATPGWDKALIEHYSRLDNKIQVYHLQDSRDDEGTPHPIVTREYIEALGYFLPPLFLHWYVDTWTVGIAKAAGCFTHLKDFMLIHAKPSDHGRPDDTHTRIRALGWAQRDKEVWEACQHFYHVDRNRLTTLMQRGVIPFARDHHYAREQA